MSNCETCARWVPFDYTDCVNPPAVPRGWCESPDPRVPESGAHGPLCSRADFGCVAHERRAEVPIAVITIDKTKCGRLGRILFE